MRESGIDWTRMQDTQPQHALRRYGIYLSAFFMDFTFSSGSIAATYCAKERFGATSEQLGLYAFLSASVYFISAFLFGRLSDRWGRRPNIVLACVMNMGGYAMAPWAGTLWQLYAVMMVCSVGQAAFWPAIAADISDHSTPDELPGRLGRFNLAWAMGLCSGSLVGGLVGQHLGHNVGFRMPACLAVVAMLMHVLRRFTHERSAAGPTVDAPSARSASLGSLFWRLALLVNFASTGLAATVRIHMPTVTGGGQSAMGGTYIAIFLSAQFISFFVLAHWHGWRFRFAPFVVGCLLAVTGAAVCGLFAGSFVFGAGCLLAGLGCGVSANLSLYYSVAASSGRGLRGGIHEGVLASGAAVIPYVGGWLAADAFTGAHGWAKGIPHLAAGTVLAIAFLTAMLVFARSAIRRAAPQKETT